jgi:hypothetical protein
MEPVVAQVLWTLVLATLLVVALRRNGWLWLAVPAGQTPPGPRLPDDGSEEEQQPETDRAPRRGFQGLTAAVALTAAVRLGFLVALHR